MNDIELIKAEIERMHQEAVLAACGNPTDWLRSRIATCVDLLSFIDSPPEDDHFRDSTKMVSEDLEEAADSQIRKMVDAAGHPGWDWTTQDVVNAFIAGAKWQKAKDDEEREENKRKENELPRFYGD